jgi:biopolymer transport protein ExbB/TolQ
MSLDVLSSSLHALSSALQAPVIFLLLLFTAVVIIEIGSLIAEGLAERRGKRLDAAKMLEDLQKADEQHICSVIKQANLLNRHKKALLRLWQHRDLDITSGQALAVQILSEQEQRIKRILSFSDVIVKLAPMLGLMGTLIPLGPGMIALGQGDIQTLANSLLSAFDTTIAGLATGGVAFVISKIRKLWYEKDLMLLETLINGVLSVMYSETE